MAVSYVASGAIASGTGNVSPALPAGYAVGDIFFLTVESVETEAVATPSGWNKVDGTPVGATVSFNPDRTGSAVDSTRLTVFWRRATTLAEAAPTVTDPGDHAVARIHAFRGCVPIGVPWDVINLDVDLTGTGTTRTFPAVTTAVNNCMIVNIASTGADGVGAANSTAYFSAWTNASLTSLTEQADDCRIDGNGGGIGLATGFLAVKGASGSTTVTVASATSQFAALTVALMPAVTVSTSGMRSLGPQGATQAGVFDVVSYGADRTGTNDSTAAFQAAMDYAGIYASNTGGATVKVPAGSYKIQGRVTLKGRLTIDAYGAYVFGGTDYVFPGNIMFASAGSTGYDGGCDNVTVLGGTWDAKGQNCAVSANTGNGDINHRDIFCFGNSRGWSFKDCNFRNVPSWHALDVNSVDGLTVESCYFEGFVDKSFGGGRADSEAIQLDTGGDGTPCQNVVVSGCSMGPARDDSGLATFGKLIGSHTPTNANTSWHNNIRISDNYVNGSSGAVVQGYDWSNATITGNTFLNAAADCIKFYGQVSGTAEQIVITGNVIDGFGARGIYFTDSSSTGVGFSGCIIRGNSIRGAGTAAAIDVKYFDQGVVDGNQITVQGTGHGIFGDICTDTSVTKNNVKGVTTDLFSGGAGIQWQAATRCTIGGNKVYSSSLHGIWTSGGGTDIVITDNFVMGANRSNGTNYGIYVGGTGLTNPSVRNNTIRKFGSGSEATAGLRFVSACTGVVAEGNDTADLDNSSNVPTSRHAGEVYINGGTQGVRTSDLTGLNSASLATVTGLTATVPAAGLYVFKCHLTVRGVSGTSPTIRFTANGPTASMISYSCQQQTSTAGAVTATRFAVWQGAYTANVASTTNDYSVEITGSFYATASGTLTIQYICTGTTPSYTVRSGSMLQLEALGKST